MWRLANPVSIYLTATVTYVVGELRHKVDKIEKLIVAMIAN